MRARPLRAANSCPQPPTGLDSHVVLSLSDLTGSLTVKIADDEGT